jgi:osmotically inducible lipoprotein OsmB
MVGVQGMSWHRFFGISLLALLLGGCSNMSTLQQRALSGGAIGAASGMAIAAITDGSLLTGGLLGAAGGAVIGAVTH